MLREGSKSPRFDPIRDPTDVPEVLKILSPRPHCPAAPAHKTIRKRCSFMMQDILDDDGDVVVTREPQEKIRHPTSSAWKIAINGESTSPELGSTNSKNYLSVSSSTDYSSFALPDNSSFSLVTSSLSSTPSRNLSSTNCTPSSSRSAHRQLHDVSPCQDMSTIRTPATHVPASSISSSPSHMTPSRVSYPVPPSQQLPASHSALSLLFSPQTPSRNLSQINLHNTSNPILLQATPPSNMQTTPPNHQSSLINSLQTSPPFPIHRPSSEELPRFKDLNGIEISASEQMISLHQLYLQSAYMQGTHFGCTGALHKRKGGQVRFTNDQTIDLEDRFARKKYLSPVERKQIANRLRLTERQIKTWFQNRRAKWRRLKEENAEKRVTQDGGSTCSDTSDSEAEILVT